MTDTTTPAVTDAELADALAPVGWDRIGTSVESGEPTVTADQPVLFSLPATYGPVLWTPDDTARAAEPVAVLPLLPAPELETLRSELANLRPEIEELKSLRAADADRYAMLTRSLESQLESVRASASRYAANHREDIARIGETLLEEAESRNWCSDFDEVVESLNRYLHVELPTRDRDWTVVVSVTVTARDADGAASLVRQAMRDAEGISDYDIGDIDEQ